MECNQNIKLLGSVPDNLNPLIIKAKFLIQFLTLKVIAFMDKLKFTWKNDGLMIDKEFFGQGHSL